MKQVLPRFHVVKTSFLDVVKAQVTHKVTTIGWKLPGFAAILQRHLEPTQVRVVQDLDVITLLVNIQAEAAAIILDTAPTKEA
eukprot:1151372-Amphidinium_carterae.1